MTGELKCFICFFVREINYPSVTGTKEGKCDGGCVEGRERKLFLFLEAGCHVLFVLT